MKVFKSICNCIITVLLIGILFITGTFLTSKYILKDSVPNVFGFSIFKVISGSMRPEIKIGDFVVVKKTTDYTIGDVITYVDEGKNLITHRVVDIAEDKIVTKGDYNNVEDPDINKKQVFGKVIFTIESGLVRTSFMIAFIALMIVAVVNVGMLFVKK